MNRTIRCAARRVMMPAFGATILAAVLAIAGCGGGGGGGGSETSTFSKSYGGPLHDEASVVLNTDDGGFMLFGTADAPGEFPGGDFWLQKLDANGNVEHSRTIGLRSAAGPGTQWKRARPTADGGVVLAGTHEVTTKVARPAGNEEDVIVDRNLAVTKLDAAGNVVWNVIHDSGAWLNYDYFVRNGTAAVALDSADDVWPMADGGFLVAGTSTANLEDRLGIGFPCDDAELNALSVDAAGDSTCGGGQSGFRFVEAHSAVVMRLNADGSLRWVRRLIDNPYDSRNNRRPEGLSILVRATADGGVVLSRPVGRKSALVHRLRADGAPLWRTVLRDVLFAVQVSTPSIPPVDLIQTDDAVDGPDRDLHDGLADDGFALATVDRVIKLAADGTVEWNAGLTLQGSVRFDPQLIINRLTQHCDYGRPTRCDVVVLGSVDTQTAPLIDPDLGTPSGFVAFVNHDGSTRTQVYAPRDAAGVPTFTSFLRIAMSGPARFVLLGSSGDKLGLIELDAPSEPPASAVFANARMTDPADVPDTFPELRPDGRLLLLQRSGWLLRLFDAQGRLQSALRVGEGTVASEVLRTAVQIGPGRFVLAGTQRTDNGQSGIVALRYDLDANGGRIVWQRRLVAYARGDLLAAVPGGDGGAVLSLSVAVPGEAIWAGQLLKLDSEGRRLWQSPLPAAARQLQRLPDGGFAALSFSSADSRHRVTRLSAAGERLWQHSVWLGAEQGALEAMAATADGGLVLAGSFGSRLRLVRLAADGALVSAADVDLRAVASGASFDELRVRQAADGGFVLAATERGLLAASDTDGQVLPRGQSNVLVFKFDAGFQPQWSHVYGGLFNEGVRDLALRADGTIAVAGYSDSLGERREAWLLKLAPSGLIADGGCRALLTTIAPWLISVGPGTVAVEPAPTDEAAPAELPPFEDTSAPLHEPQDFVTARQCLGSASAGSPVAPGPTWRLSVLQVGTARGVVSSVPSGISCGTGLDICTAEFAQGSRVALRADASRFVAWRGDCDEGTGGTSLDCVIRLSRDRTIQVEFGAPPPPPPTTRFTLSFAVQGDGFVRSADGIDCGEAGSAAQCSRDYAAGTLVDVTAVPFAGQAFLGWSGESAGSPCIALARQTSVRITVDRNLRCFAQFGPAEQRLLTIAVAGGGVVRDQPASGAIECREGGGQAECQETYSSTVPVALLALPDAGWRFAGWGGACAANGLDPGITLLMAQGQSCSASFVPIAASATLTVTIGNGTVDRIVDSQPAGIACSGDPVSDCSETFATGTSVLLHATLFGLQSWQGCDEVLDVNFCRVTMNQVRSVTANYGP
jgi:Divergent InlB B-repeat domain/Domain of unknown function (DUF5122) beta-propeller